MSILALGWHVQLHWTAEQIVSHESLLKSLGCPMVFDHFARIPALNFRSHPAFDIVSALLSERRAWVKLSGAHLATGHSDDSSYADLRPLARALIACAPTRMLWGSDWPHTTEEVPKPNDASLFELLGHWAGSNEQLRQILVTNPAELYGFADSVPTGP